MPSMASQGPHAPSAAGESPQSAPYMGRFRRLKVKEDDVWAITIQWVLACAFILLIFIVVFACYFSLPKPKSSADAGTKQFSEQRYERSRLRLGVEKPAFFLGLVFFHIFFFWSREFLTLGCKPLFSRAKQYHDDITDLVGVRPYGSVANRVTMRGYLLAALEKIRVATSVNGVDRISYSARSHPGESPADYRGNENKMVWENMGNIVCRVHASTSTASAILVSAHYDTVFLSKGATDNTPSVSSMLEMIYVLAHDDPQRHEAMFVFVNGEEFGLLGSLDMSRFDSLMTKVGIVMNVDGTPGAKQLALRTTGGAVDQIYGYAPRPLAFVVGSDIFGAGLVKSDTDWSVYAEDTPAMDLVTFSHRQTYHTMKDVEIRDGLLQFQGDNMLAIIRRTIAIDITSLGSLASVDDPGNVYFSVLNRGYVLYSLHTNWVVFVLLIVGYVVIYAIILTHRFIWWRDLKMDYSSHPVICLLLGAAFILATFLICVIITAIVGFITYAFTPMFSYISAGMVVFAMGPVALCALYLSQFLLQLAERRMGQPLETNRTRLLWGTGFIWWILLCALSGASKTTGSTYLLFYLALFHLCAVVLHHVLWFFGVVKELKKDDVFEMMEDQERKEDEEDEKSYLEDGVIKTRPSRAIPHRRWLAAFSPPDMAWFGVFLLATWPPMLFWIDVMVPLLQMAATDMVCYITAPIIAILVFLLKLNFLPLSRRSHHYGVITLVFLILSVVLWLPIVLTGMTHFTANAPYQVLPEQKADKITLTAEYSYGISPHKLAMKIDDSKDWNCDGDTCSASGFAQPVIPTSQPITPPHGLQYAAQINSSNSWIHLIQFPVGTELAVLNDVLTSVDPGNGTVVFLLDSLNKTESWTVEYTGPQGNITVSSYFDDEAAVPSMPSLIANMPDWGTFHGRGSWLATQTYIVDCTKT